MTRRHIHHDNKDQCYFITCTTRQWYYIFDRHNRWNILAESLQFCQKNKDLKIYAYVFMLNHLHLIIQSKDAVGFIRDFKRFTAQKMLDNIKKTEPTVLDLFKKEDGYHQFWKEGNHPQILENQNYFLQKLHYIHNNPVRKGYVDKAHFWKWSSANPRSEINVDLF